MKTGYVNTVFFDAADTLFYIKDGLGPTYAGVAQKHGAQNAEPDVIKKAFVKAFNSAPPLAFGDVSADDRKKLEKDYWRVIVEQVYSEVGMFDGFDDHFEELFEVFRSRAWTLFPETKETLETLKEKGMKLGIISNFDSRVYDVMQDLGITGYFDFFVISSEAGYAKPESRIFKIALQEADSTAIDCIHIGDNLNNDFHCPRTVGIQALLIDREGENENLGAHHRIKDLTEIHNYV